MSAGTATAAVRERRSGLPKVARRLLRSPHFVVGATLSGAILFVAIFAPWLAPKDPYFQDYANVLKPVGSPGFPLGTDPFGRDMLSRLIFGARISVSVGAASVGLGMLVGVALGVAAGYFRRLDRPIMMFVDILIAFPGILLAIAIVAALGPGLENVVLAVALFSVPTFARITRASVMDAREAEYVHAAKAIGARDPRIIVRSILPNIISPIVIYASLRLATSILTAATLSFLGLGAQPPIAEWGAMISDARTYLYSARSLSIIPGIGIFVTVLAFNLVGDGLRDALDPRSA
jgi:peptide/nickel transport system permease protein